MADDMSESSEEQIPLGQNPALIDKYKTAADIANKALNYVITLIKPGVSVLAVCQAGDDFIIAEADKVSKSNKKILKGVAFPTSISVNNTVANFSPLNSDPIVVIAEGDVVKIDLGAHIDGTISQVAHTVIATENPQQPTTGRKADAICAAHYAGEAALRLLRPGNKGSQITKVIRDIADVFQCNPVIGFNSTQIDRFTVEGQKVIPNALGENEKVDDVTFEKNDVYVIDILMSTGEGKPREGDTKTTVFMKTDRMYGLKVQASRKVFSEITTRFNKLPFSLRALDEKKARLGINECIKHELVRSFPVVYEKDGEYVAQFKFTVLLLPNSIQKVNGPFGLPFVQSQYNITDPAISAILAQGLSLKKKKKKNKKPAAAQPADSSSMDTS